MKRLRKRHPIATHKPVLRPRVAHVFDLDGTLVTQSPDADIKVWVVDGEGRDVERLHLKEVKVPLPEGHVLDWREWRCPSTFDRTQRVNHSTLAEFIRARSKYDTIILTARGDMYSRVEFARALRRRGIDVYATHVYRLGSSVSPVPTVPEKKKSFIRDAIKHRGWREVHFYDDDECNLRAVSGLKREHLGVNFKLYIVADGKIKRWT